MVRALRGVLGGPAQDLAGPVRAAHGLYEVAYIGRDDCRLRRSATGEEHGLSRVSHP